MSDVTLSNVTLSGVEGGVEGGDLSTLFEQALKNIYDEAVDVKKGIEPNLFNVTFEKLNDAVDTGFGSISYDHPDFDFVNELKSNNGVFAAFKTHRQQNDIAQQLVGPDGKLKSFAQFKADTESIIGEYNKNWLQTEYDTAVIRARMAARFKEFQRDADLYPNLKWTKSTSHIAREAHMDLYGLILPINHPFWLSVYPGNLWNCKCGITNTDEPENGHLYNIDSYDMPVPPGLEGNPAYTGKIFSDRNPYKMEAYKGAEKATASYVHDVLAKFADQILKGWRNSIEKYTGLDKGSKSMVSGNLKILRRSIDDVRDHKATFSKMLYLKKIDQDIENWRYLGWKEVENYPEGHRLAGLRKHNDTEYFTYYSSSIDEKRAYMVVKMHRNYKTEVLYCITDTKAPGIIEGLPRPIKKK